MCDSVIMRFITLHYFITNILAGRSGSDSYQPPEVRQILNLQVCLVFIPCLFGKILGVVDIFRLKTTNILVMAGLRGGPKGPGSQAPHQKGPPARSVYFLNTIVLFAISIEYDVLLHFLLQSSIFLAGSRG